MAGQGGGPADRLHPVGSAGPRPTGDHGPRCGARAGRGRGLGVRHAGHLRALPGRGERRRVPQARDHLRARTTCPRSAPRRPPTADRKGMAEGRRLACTAEVLADVVIDVPAESQVHRQVVRKDLDLRRFPVDPVIRLRYVEVPEPDLATPRGELSRLLDALDARVGADGPRGRTSPSSGTCSRRCATAAAASPSRSTAGTDLIAVWPGLKEADLRGGDRHRLDHDRRAPRGPRHRRRCWRRPGR